MSRFARKTARSGVAHDAQGVRASEPELVFSEKSRSVRTHCRVILRAWLDLPQTPLDFASGKSCTGVLRLARRPLKRSADFSGCLVAVLIQFLESLLQRPEFHGAFRWPFPINIESVGGRWTGHRGLHEGQRRLQRCVVTVVGRHICTPYKIGIGRDSIRWNSVWSRAGVVSLRRTVCCLDARARSI